MQVSLGRYPRPSQAEGNTHIRSGFAFLRKARFGKLFCLASGAPRRDAGQIGKPKPGRLRALSGACRANAHAVARPCCNPWSLGLGSILTPRLEPLVSPARIRHVQISETGLQKHLTPACARFLHQQLTQWSQIVVQSAPPAPVERVERFTMVVLEDSCLFAWPAAREKVWQGCGGVRG